MTEDQINIAIHEIRGFKQVDPKSYMGLLRSTIAFIKDGVYYGGPPPRYTEDLNEIHEVEKLLSDESYEYKFSNSTYRSSQNNDYFQLLMYGNQPDFLSDGCGKYDDTPNPPKSLPHLAGGLKADARQKAEALVRVFNKWID